MSAERCFRIVSRTLNDLMMESVSRTLKDLMTESVRIVRVAEFPGKTTLHPRCRCLPIAMLFLEIWTTLEGECQQHRSRTVDSFAMDFSCNCSRRPPHRARP